MSISQGGLTTSPFPSHSRMFLFLNASSTRSSRLMSQHAKTGVSTCTFIGTIGKAALSTVAKTT